MSYNYNNYSLFVLLDYTVGFIDFRIQGYYIFYILEGGERMLEHLVDSIILGHHFRSAGR